MFDFRSGRDASRSHRRNPELKRRHGPRRRRRPKKWSRRSRRRSSVFRDSSSSLAYRSFTKRTWCHPDTPNVSVPPELRVPEGGVVGGSRETDGVQGTSTPVLSGVRSLGSELSLDGRRVSGDNGGMSFFVRVVQWWSGGITKGRSRSVVKVNKHTNKVLIKTRIHPTPEVLSFRSVRPTVI